MAYEIEKAVLFYLIEGFDSSRLDESLFSYPDHRLIYKEIQAIKSHGNSLDFVILAEKMGKTHPEIKPSYITSLGDDAIKGKFGESYFRDYVNQLARLQKEKQIKSMIAGISGEPDFIPSLKEILKDYEPDEMANIEDFSISSHTQELKSYIETRQGLKYWGHEIKSFPVLTSALMGIREITVLAAKAKTGKSTLALQIASDLHKQGVGILYFDFENGRFNLMAREISRKLSVSFEEIFQESGESEALIKSGLLRLDEYKNFFIVTDRKLTIEKIRAQVKQIRNLMDGRDVFIVIDSLQKLPMENLRERRAGIDFWLRGIEEINAEDPGLSILLISELSREGGKPKESGDIEYTGHFLLELQANQTEEELAERGDDNIRKLFIRAARDVQIPAGPLKYETDFRYWKFSELEEK